MIPGILFRSSYVLIGPPSNRHRMVPFHLPSITLSVASIGHGEISFFETLIACFTDKFVSAPLCIQCQLNGV